MRIKSVGHVLLCGFFVIAGFGASAAPPEEQVEAAIARGVKWVLEKNTNGSWEELATPSGPDYDPNGRQWGGRTSLATYAMLAAGQSDQEPRIKQAIEFLKKAELEGTYALGLRCQVWYYLPNNPETHALVTRDTQALQACMRTKGKAHGLFRYWKGSGADDYCHSCSNYGVLGLWACAQQNSEIPPQQWAAFEDAWQRHQSDEGGWSYRNDDKSEFASKLTVSMTAAGVATLFITQDYAHSMEGIGCVGNPWDPHIHRGIQWISKNFDLFEQNHPFYALYNIERVGVASGLKFFGNIDWYDRGAKWLLARQGGDGSWSGGNVVDTCFALLFLVRGRAPLVMSKLDYTPVDFLGKNPRNVPAVWNQRSRDCANISRWIGRAIEKDLNWQVVHLKAPLEDLHDAPILYVSGSKELTFGKEDRAKLKAWVQAGGLILGNADCGKAGFADSFRKIGEELFAPYKFRELPADHIIFKDEAFKRINWKNPPQLLGLTNGAREFMLLFPTADPARFWQQQSFLGPEREPLAQLMANIFLYAVDKQNLRHRGEPFLVQKKADVKPVRTIKIARLQYDGNWDPEPYGWQRLAAIMHNTYASPVEVSVVKVGDKFAKELTAVHITGTEAFTLSPLTRVEMRKYLEGGGTLIVDACGGSREFALAAEAELHDLYPTARLDLLKPESPVYNPVVPGIAEVAYRSYFIRNYARMKTPRLRGMEVNKRTAIIFSAEDLSSGMIGQPVDGILGYVPASASQIMSYALLYAAGVRPPPPPEAPKPEAFNLAEAMDKFAPGWTGTGCFKVNDPGIKEQLAGRETVLVTTGLDAKNPVILSRQQGVPPGRITTLSLVVGHPEKGSWDLVVRADDQEIFKASVNPETCLGGWREISVDLSSFAGKEIKLELVQIPSPGAADKSGWWGLIKIQARKE